MPKRGACCSRAGFDALPEETVFRSVSFLVVDDKVEFGRTSSQHHTWVRADAEARIKDAMAQVRTCIGFAAAPRLAFIARLLNAGVSLDTKQARDGQYCLHTLLRHIDDLVKGVLICGSPLVPSRQAMRSIAVLSERCAGGVRLLDLGALRQRVVETLRSTMIGGGNSFNVGVLITHLGLLAQKRSGESVLSWLAATDYRSSRLVETILNGSWHLVDARMLQRALQDSCKKTSVGHRQIQIELCAWSNLPHQQGHIEQVDLRSVTKSAMKVGHLHFLDGEVDERERCGLVVEYLNARAELQPAHNKSICDLDRHLDAIGDGLGLLNALRDCAILHLNNSNYPAHDVMGDVAYVMRRLYRHHEGAVVDAVFDFMFAAADMDAPDRMDEQVQRVLLAEYYQYVHPRSKRYYPGDRWPTSFHQWGVSADGGNSPLNLIRKPLIDDLFRIARVRAIADSAQPYTFPGTVV